MSFRIIIAALLLTVCTGVCAMSSCSVSATGVAIGAYNEFAGSPTDSVGNVAVTCRGPNGYAVAYSIKLSAGAGTFQNRRMRSHHYGTLAYNLYPTAARVTIWGDGSSGTVVVSDGYVLGGAQVTRNYPVYARAPARQKAPVGAYADSIVVTLEF